MAESIDNLTDKGRALLEEALTSSNTIQQRRDRILTLALILFFHNPPSDNDENYHRVKLFADCLSVVEPWKVTQEMHFFINNALRHVERLLALFCNPEQVKEMGSDKLPEFFKLQVVERALKNSLVLVEARLAEEEKQQQADSSGLLSRLKAIFQE